MPSSGAVIMFQFGGLLKIIEEYDIITLFRHAHPDCDAAGSQFGLKNWIEENWPDKRVYALGMEYCTQGSCWPLSDSVSKEDLKNSAAIILDTANLERIDDDSWKLAKTLIKIDHHPNIQPYGDEQYVFVKSASTCEIVADFMRQCPDKVVSTKTAEFLFRGMLTDTLSFRTSNTTPHSLETAGWISQFGVRIPDLNRELFDQDLESFKFANMLRGSVQIREGKMAYRIVSLEEMQEWDKPEKDVKNFIEEFGHVQDFEIYAIFCENNETGTIVYNGSLRSKRVTINDVAERFHGGGHKNACGVKGLNPEELEQLLEALYAKIPQ